jgi:lysosomal acid lipase/cholesteryl ester hydrolase
MGNNRGNVYSRGHKTLNPEDDDEYFDYSFYEFGKYDIPAMIDYVRDYTG